MSPKALGFAVIGLDHWYSALDVAKAMAAYPDGQLRWVVDANAERAQAIAEKNGALHHATDYAQALADPEVDVIACYASIERGPEIYIAAAEAGKHIISIKPMAMDLESARRVVKAVKKAGVKYLAGSSNYQFSATHLKCKEWIDAGRIGELVAGNSIFHAGLPQDWPGSNQAGWFVDPKRVPGGGWLDHAIYFVQVFRSFFGAEVASVDGTTANLKFPQLAVEDYGQATLTFTNGKIATLTSTWLAAAGGSRQGVEFFGTNGTVVADTLLNKVAVSGDFGDALKGWIQVARPDEPISRPTLMIEQLVEAIRSGGETGYTVHDDYANLAVCLAFYEAAKSKRAVVLAA